MWVSATNKFSGQSVAGKHVFGIERRCLFCINFLSTWDEHRHFGAVVVGDGEDGIISLRLWEFGNEI